jgi:exodeoxyribonuclease VII large subunit
MMLSAKKTYTVSEITEILRHVVESEPTFQDCWIEGEISNLARPRSGHIYFKLKDDKSQISCAIFRQSVARLQFPPKDGDAVLLHGRLGIYEARGEYQIIGDRMQPAGIGALQLAFERLKEQLADEGLFDPDHKKPLPEFPQKIGVITSATGAAVQDILRMLKERYPLVQVVLCPTLVQGDEAAPMIARAVERMNRFSDIDLLIVGRGGGSIEDLWAFNEEIVARAIFASEIPTVSAVGHETDYTIADFVADFRAPTPSAAVELIVPDQAELRRQIGDFQVRLERSIKACIASALTELSNIENRIVPSHRIDAINRFYQTIDRLEIQSHREIKQRLIDARGELDRFAAPLKQLATRRIKTSMERWNLASAQLAALNPIATLARGYSVCQSKNGEVITDASQTEDGEELNVRLSRGALTCEVVEKRAD